MGDFTVAARYGFIWTTYFHQLTFRAIADALHAYRFLCPNPTFSNKGSIFLLGPPTEWVSATTFICAVTEKVKSFLADSNTNSHRLIIRWICFIQFNDVAKPLSQLSVMVPLMFVMVPFSEIVHDTYCIRTGLQITFPELQVLRRYAYNHRYYVMWYDMMQYTMVNCLDAIITPDDKGSNALACSYL